jgi:hypothetical protein
LAKWEYGIVSLCQRGIISLQIIQRALWRQDDRASRLKKVLLQAVSAYKCIIASIEDARSVLRQSIKIINPGVVFLASMNRFLRVLTITLVVLALAFSGVLLIRDAGIGAIRSPARGTISAASLLLVGIAFLIVQPIMRLRPKEFLKNLLLATSFILWGVVQLMPQNVLAMRLGGLVVTLYVLELAWVTLLSANSTGQPVTQRACLATCSACRRT